MPSGANFVSGRNERVSRTRCTAGLEKIRWCSSRASALRFFSWFFRVRQDRVLRCDAHSSDEGLRGLSRQKLMDALLAVLHGVSFGDSRSVCRWQGQWTCSSRHLAGTSLDSAGRDSCACQRRLRTASNRSAAGTRARLSVRWHSLWEAHEMQRAYAVRWAIRAI